jgi:hypothetical protein
VVTRRSITSRIRLPSSTVTRAVANISNWSGCRCSIAQTMNAASATGSVVPWANTSLAALNRLTA